MPLLTLEAWGRATYGEGAPNVCTLRRWAREGKIPGAEKHGRSYFVSASAHYCAANDAAKVDNVRRRGQPIPHESAANLLEKMIHGRKAKTA